MAISEAEPDLEYEPLEYDPRYYIQSARPSVSSVGHIIAERSNTRRSRGVRLATAQVTPARSGSCTTRTQYWRFADNGVDVGGRDEGATEEGRRRGTGRREARLLPSRHPATFHPMGTITVRASAPGWRTRSSRLVRPRAAWPSSAPREVNDAIVIARLSHGTVVTFPLAARGAEAEAVQVRHTQVADRELRAGSTGSGGSTTGRSCSSMATAPRSGCSSSIRRGTSSFR